MQPDTSERPWHSDHDTVIGTIWKGKWQYAQFCVGQLTRGSDSLLLDLAASWLAPTGHALTIEREEKENNLINIKM